MPKNPEKNKQAMPVPWWGKLIVGAVTIALIMKFTPIVDILALFFYIVCVPLMLALAVGLVSAGTYEAIRGGIDSTMNEVKSKVDQKLREAAA